MNRSPWSPVLQYTTPLPMNRTPVSTVALQHKSVSSVLRYATPLPIDRTPISTVGGPFPPFCGTPHPSRSIGPRSERRRFVSSVLRYARPRFHRLFRPSPPDEQDPRFDRSAPTQVRFIRFAVRHTPPDQQDPRFHRRWSVSSVLRYARPLPINMTPFRT